MYEGSSLMIRFSCDHCSHNISVQAEHAGKRCRCQQCESIVVVPDKSTIFDFNCDSCGKQIIARISNVGKKCKCPRCGCSLVIPGLAEFSSRGRDPQTVSEQAPAQKNDTPVPGHTKDTLDGLSLEERQLLAGEMKVVETGQTGERALPWLVDIFLYPTNASGIVHILIFLVTPILINLLDRFVFSFAYHYGTLVTRILYVFLVGYAFFYFSECIRDSAAGGIRAPDTLSSNLGKDQMLEQFLTLLACCAVFGGPAIFYRGYAYFTQTEVSNAIFWSLLAPGAFLFPMGVLAVVMFDSINGLNPVLLLCSVANTFFQYCGLAIVFSAFLLVRVQMLLWSAKYQWGILTRILPDLILLWLLFVVTHLIGRFYWQYEEKLNWEV